MATENIIPHGQVRQEAKPTTWPVTVLSQGWGWARERFGELSRRTIGAPHVRVLEPPRPSEPPIDLAQERKRRLLAFLGEKSGIGELNEEELKARIESYKTPPPVETLVEGPLLNSEMATLRAAQTKIDNKMRIRNGFNFSVALPDQDPIIEQLKRDRTNAKRREKYHTTRNHNHEAQLHRVDYLRTTVLLFEHLRDQQQDKVAPLVEEVKTRTIARRGVIGALESYLQQDAATKAAQSELMESSLDSQRQQDQVMADEHAKLSDRQVAIERIRSLPLDEALRWDPQFQAALADFNRLREVTIQMPVMPEIVAVPDVKLSPPVERTEWTAPHYDELPIVKQMREERAKEWSSKKFRLPSVLSRNVAALTVAGVGVGMAIASLWGSEANTSVSTQQALTPEQPVAGQKLEVERPSTTDPFEQKNPASIVFASEIITPRPIVEEERDPVSEAHVIVDPVDRQKYLILSYLNGVNMDQAIAFNNNLNERAKAKGWDINSLTEGQKFDLNQMLKERPILTSEEGALFEEWIAEASRNPEFRPPAVQEA